MSLLLREDAVALAVVRVCTFNLRRDGMDRGTPNDWVKRRPIMKKCLEVMKPLIIGTQEGTSQQLDEILADLKESSAKSWSYVGNVVDELNSQNAIFYCSDLFYHVKSGTFWFNENRTTFGPAWGAKYSCACTWAHLQHIRTENAFVIFNVHLDYPSKEARRRSIPVLLDEIKKNYELREVIVTGDFNNWPEEVEGTTPIEDLIILGQNASEIKQMKEATFIDTYEHGETSTFNGFRSAGYGPKIDFIWITSDSVYSVDGDTKVDDYHDENGFFPSDHFPVYADLVAKAIQ